MMPTGIAAMLTGVLTMAVVSAFLILLVWLLHRTPHDTE
jgi:hypothetical protein